MTTPEQLPLIRARLDLARRFGIGGDTWVATRPNSSGGTDTIGMLAPVYVVQELPSKLERMFATSAAALQARWAMVARTDVVSTLAAGDTLTSGSLSFLVTGLDSTALPGLTSATLEKKPFS